MVVDPVAILATMYGIEDHAEFLRSALADVPHLRLTYEHELVDPAQQQQTVDRVCAFLNLDRAAASSEFVKITPRTTPEQVLNFEDLAAVLARTRYARYVAEPG
jgi:hypothetical protein